MTGRRLEERDVACWVLKANPKIYDLRAALEHGEEINGWTLHKTYRVQLMAPAQRCLLWLSGPDSPGVYAIGKITDFAEEDGQGGGPYWRDIPKANRMVPVISISVVGLGTPIARAELISDRRFADAEVIKMAAGSNPSYLNEAQLAAVKQRLTVPDIRQAGW